jgi:hypothetical protein
VLKVVLKGGAGTQSLDLFPPNPGGAAAMTLAVAGGDVYCVSFGGAAGGTVPADTARLWRIRAATAEPGCPATCCELGGLCAWGPPDEDEDCSGVGGGFPASFARRIWISKRSTSGAFRRTAFSEE